MAKPESGPEAAEWAKQLRANCFGTDRLSALAILNAAERLEMSHPFLQGGGLSKQQIADVNLGSWETFKTFVARLLGNSPAAADSSPPKR